MGSMKQTVKAFVTILALLLGAYLVRENLPSEYHNADPEQAIAGLVLASAGLTAVWVHYKDKISK